VNQVILNTQPDTIIHVANHANSKQATQDPEGYASVNLHATQHIQDAADLVGAQLVFISSFAALTPSDVYGQFKQQSENIVKHSAAGYLIIRPSFIMGMSPNKENDRPFNRLLKYLDQKEAGEFDTSWRFQPTYIGHVSAVVTAALKENIMNTTVHVFSPSITTQYQLAQDILKPFDITVRPIDKKMTLPLQERDDTELSILNLPTCSYQTMITSIQNEITNRFS
jgi:dTDP-4-dehydrorhamnose reductase